jgi:hypothetical protein
MTRKILALKDLILLLLMASSNSFFFEKITKINNKLDDNTPLSWTAEEATLRLSSC